MTKEIIFPFTWETFGKDGTSSLSFYDVTFIEDFGVFKKGDIIKRLDISYERGIIEDCTENGTKVIRKQLFKAIAI